jgi:hypothetical protein
VCCSSPRQRTACDRSESFWLMMNLQRLMTRCCAHLSCGRFKLAKASNNFVNSQHRLVGVRIHETCSSDLGEHGSVHFEEPRLASSVEMSKGRLIGRCRRHCARHRSIQLRIRRGREVLAILKKLLLLLLLVSLLNLKQLLLHLHSTLLCCFVLLFQMANILLQLSFELESLSALRFLREEENEEQCGREV